MQDSRLKNSSWRLQPILGSEMLTGNIIFATALSENPTGSALGGMMSLWYSGLKTMHFGFISLTLDTV